MCRKNVKLLTAMASAGYTGRRLAETTGISYVTISLILNQRREPNPKTSKLIAKALSTTADALGFLKKGVCHEG